MTKANEKLIDRFGREVTYVRFSVTDRCDFRCEYCMAEEMTFLPRQQILTLEEFYLLGKAFTEMGVRKIRLTGGEPLIRSNIIWLCEKLAALPGLDELVLTTNGSQLTQYAKQLKDAGVKRINISLDSLNAGKFRKITRVGDLSKVLAGIDAAREQGFENIKINSVILKGYNDDELIPLMDFILDRNLDITFIEEMPLGNVSPRDRALSYMSSDEIRQILSDRFSLVGSTVSTGGPSKYYQFDGSSSKVGFISPHSHNFCSTCNRVRVTSEGRLLLCLGNEHSMDLRERLRSHPGELEPVKQALRESMEIKPERHYFDLNEAPQIVRFMNMTGG